MNRRTFLHAAAGLAAAPLLVRRPWRDAPNVILIVADDLGYGDLSITGRADYRTPVLDQLARDGVQLTQAYSSAPVCTPTRVAMMTGRYPARYRAGLYEPLTIQQGVGLAPAPPTLPRLLKNAGFDTALVGKWHLGLAPAYRPHRHGFDEFYGFLGPAADYASHVDSETRHVSYFMDGERPVRASGYLTDLFTERALAIVGRRRNRPLFLSLQYSAPHWPWQAPGDPAYPDTLGMSAGGSVATYARMVQSMDTGIGRILERIHERRQERDTLVVFTSDNGGERFSHMGPFSDRKMTLREGGIRVAAFARWPGTLRAGESCDQVCATFDWTATIAGLAGESAPGAAPFDGIDLLPALRDEVRYARELCWRVSQRRQQRAVRGGDWKYLQTETGEHLFNVAIDPGEQHDLKAREPAFFRLLRRNLDAWEAKMLPPIALDPREA